MLLANSIKLRKNVRFKIPFLLFSLFSVAYSFAQENSPYARYGLGSALPASNVVNRAMGGVAAAYADPLAINFNNPASFSRFQVTTEAKSGKPLYGRVLFDVGINIENKTLQEPNNAAKFSSAYASFSHLQLGIPLNKAWGLSFGLRQLNRISYKVGGVSAITDAGTGAFIDSGFTQYSGNGGTYLPNIGTGIAIKNFSVGVSMGYLFGRRDYTTVRGLYDTAEMKSATYDADASYGGLFFSGGAQYKAKLNSKTSLSLGLSGNLEQSITAHRDVTRVATGTTGNTDTVFRQQAVKGEVIYPASYTAGFIVEHQVGTNGSFLFGTDLMQTKWNGFRFFDAVDSVQDNWQVRIGTQLRPNVKAGSGYFSNVTYRAGFYFGPDYIRIGREIPVYGISFGMGLPVANYNRLSPGQFTMINVALEYEKRGNNDNVLKENLFRLSIGLNFSDLWFNKRKYE
ncbi:MAG TPA: hypothetical protein VM010_01615 [Chitinophagaceae bacterium]|nr:hypothetical protein [Chitinophagaceae bacterium]